MSDRRTLSEALEYRKKDYGDWYLMWLPLSVRLFPGFFHFWHWHIYGIKHPYPSWWTTVKMNVFEFFDESESRLARAYRRIALPPNEQ